jgi:hypothetical protein
MQIPRQQTAPTTPYLAEQVNVDPALFAKYQWSGRTSERHRAQVRKALGFRECSEADQQGLAGWLSREVCPTELRREALRDAVDHAFVGVEQVAAQRVQGFGRDPGSAATAGVRADRTGRSSPG